MYQTYLRMLRAAGSYAGEMRASFIIGILSSMVQGITYALLFPIFINIFNGEDVTVLVAIFIGLVIVDAVFRYFGLEYEWTTQIEAGREARILLGEQLRKVPLEYLGSRKAGDLNVVLSGNVNDVVAIMGGLFNMALQTFVTPITAILITFFVDWRLALALAVIFPLAVPIYRAIRRLGARDNRISAAAHADVTSNLIEYAQGLAVLRATRQVGTKSVRLQKSLANLRAKQEKGNRMVVVPSISISVLIQGGLLFVIALGAYLFLGGTLQLAILFPLLAMSIRFAEPLSIFANLATMFDFMEAGLERMDALMDVDPLSTLDTSSSTQIDTADITFEGVDFMYAADPEIDDTPEQVLNGVSFYLPERSLTALVGPSGSGKTTITKLITRFADPQTGAVKIGGVDIRTLSQAELMKHVSVVFQDVYLFDDTIQNNIRMAKPDASDEEVTAAARAANCHEFIIRLPDGYQTTVGEIGGTLSGGERQRISIARAILKDAPIVLLDEPTSALDTESEVAVQRAIDRLVQNKTVVVIAHRLSTVVAADQILVLDDGEIIQRGTHSELLATEGRYAAMWAAQQEVRLWKV
ncbi:MAG: ABC transporter ATP-binding protein [Chloroflexota bacterium]